MKFSYKAKAADGTLATGVVEAKDKPEATSKLAAEGKTPIVLTEKEGSFGNISIPFLSNRVKLSEKIVFTKNIAGMLKAGLSLYRALQVLERQTQNRYFKSIITTLIETIDRGSTLSAGIEKYPNVFSSLVVAMVRAGEESGKMPEVLTQIGTQLEKSYALNKKIKSALMYPGIIVCAIILIGILMFIYVVPTLTKTFKELGTELPTSTKIIIWFSDALSQHTGALALAVLILFASIYGLMKLASVQRGIDYLITRLPVMGTIVKEMNAARTTRTLSSLLASGVDISRAITITKDVAQNYWYKKVLDQVLVVVQKGEPMSNVFKAETKLYPIMVGEMIEVGEETGTLGTMLLDIALFYEGEVEAKTKDLSTIIEPVLMIFVGAAVGFFAISMLTPMYSVMDTIK
ncbi:MAG TPA: type II secretion system F family protein [Candidatus Paceibacterota bacterium]|nr:type II secretion system F family protein [Candidatus Paceibacterota bacterium]